MRKILCHIFAILFQLSVFVSCSSSDRYVVFSGYAQGGTYSVKVNMKGVTVQEHVIRDSIDAILVRIDNSLSGYNKNSILSRFNRGERVVVDSLFCDMYARAWDIFDYTEGCVDPASAPLFDVWGFGFKSGEMPSDETISGMLSTCGMKRLKRDMRSVISPQGDLEPQSILAGTTSSANPQLNYNAIAQGYSCDLVASYLYSIGVKDMMVDIGEIFCDGKNPSGQQWTIGIDKPVDGNSTPGAELQAIFKVPSGPHGVVTSGNYRKFYVRDGKKYAHTVDPRTGYPVNHTLLSATIVAQDATTADAVATHCMVVGLDEAKSFILADESLEGCLVYDSEGTFCTWTSPGFTLQQ